MFMTNTLQTNTINEGFKLEYIYWTQRGKGIENELLIHCVL